MSARSIKEAVEQLAGTYKNDRVFAKQATVIDVNESERTCTCRDVSGKASVDIADVRLMAVIDDGILFIPEVGSSVCIIVSEHTQPYISQYSGLTKIVMLGGDLEGLVIVKKLTEKLNNLENKLNSLLAAYNLHTHNVTAVGAPTGPNLSPVNGTLTPTVQGDIENKNVTHG